MHHKVILNFTVLLIAFVSFAGVHNIKELLEKIHHSKQALTLVSSSLKHIVSEQEDADEEVEEEVGHSDLESFFFV